MSETLKEPERYSGLRRLLYIVRWSQHLLSIVAEVLILVSFAMSGMDVSLAGVMASVPILKILWAGMFALGTDTAFALSWVRVRRCVVRRRWLPLTWNLVLALGMSVVIFEPLAIQLLQQALGMDFNQAVANLGIDIVLLTYARAAVAVFLGTILAMTNVESSTIEPMVVPKRRLVFFEQLVNRIAPVVSEDAPPPVEVQKELDIAEQPTERLSAVLPQLTAHVEPSVVRSDTTPEEREAQVRQLDVSRLSNAERVARIAALFPNVSDRELGKLSGVSAATAKKYRDARKPALPSTLPAQVHGAAEGSR